MRYLPIPVVFDKHQGGGRLPVDAVRFQFETVVQYESGDCDIAEQIDLQVVGFRRKVVDPREGVAFPCRAASASRRAGDSGANFENFGP